MVSLLTLFKLDADLILTFEAEREYFSYYIDWQSD